MEPGASLRANKEIDMKCVCLLILTSVLTSLNVYSQNDGRMVVGIPPFSTEVASKYAGAVAQKVEEVIISTKRFTIVDRLSRDKVNEELELQKSESFINSTDLAQQGKSMGAQYLIQGHVTKLSIYNMKNPDGSVNGHRASATFKLKVTFVETGVTKEAEEFSTTESPLMLSPQSAITEALKSVEPKLKDYITKTFALKTKVSKILTTKKDAATEVLISGGQTFGFKVGDKLSVEKKEMIDGKPFYDQIGLLKVTRIAGEDFSECSVSEGGKEILAMFNAGELVSCTLIVK